MGRILVLCPHCHSDQVHTGGTTKADTQLYKCHNVACARDVFPLALTYTCLPKVKEYSIDMAHHSSGIWDTARALTISPSTGMHALKKASTPCSVNQCLLALLNLDAMKGIMDSLRQRVQCGPRRARNTSRDGFGMHPA
jgi:transposase-like protein